METNNWQEIETLFHAALQLEAAARPAYLAQECSGNTLLQREVESLIAAFEKEHSFMEQPALSLGMRVMSDALGGTLVDQLIGHYKIIRLLGSGGMGEVYLAEDTRLERHVALKFLALSVFDEGWAKQQLAKEAKAVALLEHPNICAVYGIEEADGYNFIVMQFVEGQTLGNLIKNGPLKVERVLALAEQIASALSAAHARGIIHRDIKPQNIVVTAEGQIKVLDFGLAKLIPQNAGLQGTGDNSTQASQQGLIIGTIAYMSPEQLRAEELDYRSDIFSFGIVLNEMLRGQNCFKRPSEAETISAILGSEPPPPGGPSRGIKREAERIAHKCLEKNRNERYQSADELLRALRNLQKEGVIQPSVRWTRAAHSAVRLRYYALAGLALIIGLLFIAAFNYFSQPRVQTLAVLPILNESGDSNLEYLVDGLTQSLSDKLSRLSMLHVKPPTLVSIYKDQKTDPLKAGRELNVEAALVSKLIKEDGALFLRTSLLKTADGSALWEGLYPVKVDEILTLQDDIIGYVISKLRVFLDDNEKKLLTMRPTDNPEAVRLYMLGQSYLKKRGEDNIKAALDLFEKAIEIDPVYAQAHTGRASSHFLLSLVPNGAQEIGENMTKARAAAKEALSLDPLLCEAHTALGIVLFMYDWDWRQAESQFKQAINLKPDDALAHFWYSNMLTAMGRFDEAIKQGELAIELDPFSASTTINVGRTLYNAHQFDRAIEYFQKILDKKPDNTRVLYLMALVFLKQGRYDEAVPILEKIYAEKPLDAAALLGYAYGKKGKTADALAVIEKLDELSRQKKNVPPMERAIIYIGLNDKEKAFKYLEEAYAAHFATVAYLKVEPIFDDLRADPRFADLIFRINLTP